MKNALTLYISHYKITIVLYYQRTFIQVTSIYLFLYFTEKTQLYIYRYKTVLVK